MIKSELKKRLSDSEFVEYIQNLIPNQPAIGQLMLQTNNPLLAQEYESHYKPLFDEIKSSMERKERTLDV